MITPGLAARVMFGLCLSLACSLPPCIAQSTPADQLREQLETVLAKDDLSPLDKVRQLRKLIDREETVLLEKAVAEWVEQLGGTDFASREVAQRNLIEAGPLAIAAVTRGARRDDRERAERCLNVLAALAKSEDEAIAGNAMEALQRLAKASTPIGLRAAKTVAELNETDADRALAVLARLGVNVHKDAEGEVTMITAIAPRGFTDHELRLLKAFPRLYMLTVAGEDVTDAGIEALAEVKGLRHLFLSRTSVTDKGLAKLATLPKLEMLNIGSAKITADGLRTLKDSRSLQTLGLNEVVLTDAAVDVLNGLNLRGLTLHTQKVSDEDLKLIGKLTKLSYLTLSDSANLTDEGLAALAPLALRSLHIPASKITNDGLRHLSKMTTLSTLYLGGEQITDTGLEHLNNLKSLRSISLRTTGVTEEGVTKLKAILPSLQRVYR
ncbi:MAG: hypothetical protein H6823_08165 [Planctomycetaceae bacterium]|nr:hypothetical protein [Planctomycetales bacterium]MCB9938201.1 hypothetical protein [Planctomycetaceae bacterium]